METALQEIKATPDNLLMAAIEKGLGVNEIEKLMELKLRWEADQARKAFFHAFTEFQSICPDLRKTKSVDAGAMKYSYAPLADITRQINKPLKGVGISYRWEIQDDEKQIKVTCLVSHVEGHTERTTMTSEPDASGAKNKIQARGSAIEYMKRYTLIGSLGLSTADSDIDGRMSEYEYDVDKLHKKFMEVYNQAIVLDPTMSKFHPDNWVIEVTGKNYVKAIGDLRKMLFDLQNKKK